MSLGVQQGFNRCHLVWRHELTSPDCTCHLVRGHLSFLTHNSSQFGYRLPCLQPRGSHKSDGAARCPLVTAQYDGQGSAGRDDKTCQLYLLLLSQTHPLSPTPVSPPSAKPPAPPIGMVINSLLGVSLFSLLALTGYSHCSHTHDPLEKEITNPSIHAPACKLYNGFLFVGNKVHNHFRGL